MNTNNFQAELPLGTKPKDRQPVDLDVVYRQPTFLAALKLCIHLGGFEYDKQIYQALGIDAGNWSRIMNGSASFPQDKEDELQDMCGNEVLVIWRAYRRGKGLIELRDAKDRRIAELERQLAERDSELNTLEKFGLIKRAKE